MTSNAKNIIVCLLLLFGVQCMHAEKAHAQYTEYEIKAGLIFSFAKYIKWPDRAFDSDNSIRLGILGEDPFGSIIDRALKNRSINGRRFEVKRGADIRELKNCHIIFVGRSKQEDTSTILQAIYRQRYAFVLTIGDDIDNFCKYGGIINIRKGYEFNINFESANNADLVVGAKLLDLAKEIVSSNVE
ncbi:YfiR family protein [Rapidithrix thailandica]|uniref:YfiR family protein n=1 Tax=Rapidithrix thailandica TaxID=413964 RepID=A0AAW9SA99_9BACT